MVRAFLLGVLVTLTPSLLAVAWLVWRADVPEAQEENSLTAADFKVMQRKGQTAVRRPKGRQQRRLD
jgi:hypothetical protein